MGVSRVRGCEGGVRANGRGEPGRCYKQMEGA